MSELHFDSVRHVYTLDGVILPSVTQIMRPLSSAEYAGVDSAMLKAAAARGTAIHEAIEFYAEYGAIDCPQDYMPYFAAYLKWHEEVKPVNIASEQATWHTQLLYAGTIDRTAIVDRKRTLIDVKTTAALNDMLATVQLEAYARALATHGVEVDQKAILHLRRDGTYKFKVYPARDIEAWQTFAALMTIQAHMNKYGR